jgi:MFS family permease
MDVIGIIEGVADAIAQFGKLLSGALSDHIGRRGLLAAGAAALCVADLILAFVQGPLALGAGVALWGLHMGLTQGLLSAMVADSAPEDLRGTAFGIFYAVSGAGLLVASVTAGLFWDRFSPGTPFLVGAGLSLLSLLLLPGIAARRELAA